MASDDGDPQPRQRKGGFFSRVLGLGRSEDAAPPEPVAEALRSEPEPSPEGAPEPQPSPPEPPPLESVPEPTQEAAPAPQAKQSWWRRLQAGLSRSSSSLTQGIADIFTKRRLDDEALDELEDVLLRADLGLAAANRIREAVATGRYAKDVSPEEVRAVLAEEVEKALRPVALPFELDASRKPHVILVVGVNGSGKTTTIGKLAAKFVGEGRKTLLAAGDTFRAAAIEQLQIWGARVGAEVIARAQGADPASLAYDALQRSRAEGADVLIIDTAGRLQNRQELMAELRKVVSVMKKIDPEAPHSVLLVLDATVGQNALSQVEIFGKVAGVTGLVMTKLDGTARGGILVAVAEKFALPVHYIGVGESVEDLAPFAAEDFARAIAGLGESA